MSLFVFISLEPRSQITYSFFLFMEHEHVRLGMYVCPGWPECLAYWLLDVASIGFFWIVLSQYVH